MKKALVIGNPNSIFVKQYVQDVLGGYQVVLIGEGPVNADYAKAYEAICAEIEYAPKNLWSKIPYIRSYAAAVALGKYLKKKYGQFDVVHIHGLNRLRGRIGRQVRKFAGKMIISIWGTELLQATQAENKQNRKFYDMADVITVSTAQMKNTLEQVYQNRYQGKTHINRFGLSVFDEIDSISQTETREEMCKHFGMEHPENLLVMVGYNGRPRQQHRQIVEAVCQLSEEQLKKITLVFTMTYGCTEAYLEELEREMQNVPCETVFIKAYMNDTQSARLRCITDVMIHAQPTDAFSASVQETLYCGATVFNGSWLRYAELDEYGIEMELFEDFQDLGKKLRQFVCELEGNIPNRNKKNQEILRKLSSQESTRAQWQKHLV